MISRQLIVLRDGHIVSEHAVDKALVTIGRNDTSTVALDDQKVSRCHAVVMLDGEERAYLQDLGSKNGTFMAGRRVSRTRLKPGDTFTLGTHYRCRYSESSDGSAARPRTGAGARVSADTTAEVRRRGSEGLPDFPADDRELFIGSSAGAQDLLKRVRRIAETRVNVLVSGESGSGKGVVGRLIHAWSPRAAKPFVTVNCAAIPADLVESELFGHVQGSFTGATGNRLGKFQAADGGTLFLDEIGDMSLQAQAKILRAIEDQQIEQVGNPHPIRVDVRIVAATNKDLKDAIEAKQFREDLYFRLATVTISVPPLRERPDDIVLLANCILAELVDAIPSAKDSIFTSEAIEALVSHPWRGNVRELRNVVAHALVTKDDAEILPHHLGLVRAAGSAEPLAVTASLEDAEARHIKAALVHHHWNIAQSARSLGITRVTLRARMKRLGFAAPDAIESDETEIS